VNGWRAACWYKHYSIMPRGTKEGQLFLGICLRLDKGCWWKKKDVKHERNMLILWCQKCDVEHQKDHDIFKGKLIMQKCHIIVMAAAAVFGMRQFLCMCLNHRCYVCIRGIGFDTTNNKRRAKTLKKCATYNVGIARRVVANDRRMVPNC
jgi:hypothetical protein